jgi:hypothetical protein
VGLVAHHQQQNLLLLLLLLLLLHDAVSRLVRPRSGQRSKLVKKRR